MSCEISTATPLHSRASLPDPLQKQTAQTTAEETAVKSAAVPQRCDLFRNAVAKLSAGSGHEDRHSVKIFTELVRSLEKVFGEASKVDRDTGQEEMKQGGLRRIGKDLRKLFKGLGLPPQLAKQISRGMTDALQNQNVDQLNFSMTATRSVNLDVHQLQAGYLASGDGSTIAAASSDSLQLSAIQVRSLAVSLNLRSGEFTMTRTRSDAIALSSTSTAAVVSQGTHAEETAPQLNDTTSADTTAPDTTAVSTAANVTAATTAPEPATATTAPKAAEQAAPSDDFTTLVQTDRQLLQISRVVQQSAIIQLKPAVGAESSSDEQQSGSLRVLQDLLKRLGAFSGTVDIQSFEPQVQVNDLRVEQEDGDQHLRFNLDALAPIGLTAVDENSRATTTYPRQDGSLGKVVDVPVKVVA